MNNPILLAMLFLVILGYIFWRERHLFVKSAQTGKKLAAIGDWVATEASTELSGNRSQSPQQRLSKAIHSRRGAIYLRHSSGDLMTLEFDEKRCVFKYKRPCNRVLFAHSEENRMPPTTEEERIEGGCPCCSVGVDDHSLNEHMTRDFGFRALIECLDSSDLPSEIISDRKWSWGEWREAAEIPDPPMDLPSSQSVE